MRIFRLAGAAVATALLGGCGSVRTELPVSVVPAPPLEGPVATTEVTTSESVTEPSRSATTASAYKSPGEKHPLAGGTLAASYPRVGVRPPKGSPTLPPGQAWAVVTVRFCAAPDRPIAGDLVGPDRFRVEVPGQGYLAPAPGAPPLASAPLAPGTPEIAPGTCIEGSIVYLVAGEGHVESVTYDAGDGLLRWAT